MTLNFYWRLDPSAEPARGERIARSGQGVVARDVRAAALNRYDYYAQVARAAAATAFDGLFIAYRPDSDDSQIVAAAVARTAPRLRLIPEFPSSIGSAVYAAKQAVSFQRATHNRLGWALTGDGAAVDAARTTEFLHVARGVHGQRLFNYEGEHFSVKGGGFQAPLASVPFPPVYLGGDDEDALERSAKLADVHLLTNASLELLRARAEALDRLALAAGRTVELGLNVIVSARETDEEADTSIRICGSYDSVADRLAELNAIGFNHIVLAAQPSLEEAYRIGQFVLPRVRTRIADLRAAA